MIARKLKVTWRDQPTRYDIEALQENIRRVGEVIRVRWALLGVLVTYSAFAATTYIREVQAFDLARLMVVPAIALLFVVGYNVFFGMTYRRFGNFAAYNHLQLALDTVVVTVLVYYSGGITSWFYAMYSLFVLEAAFILPKRRDAWLVAISSSVVLGIVVWLEFFDLMPHVVIPFGGEALRGNLTYVLVRYTWQIAVLFGTAAVATLLVESSQSVSRMPASILDPVTGLHSRASFQRTLAAEAGRAARENRMLHLILIDLDNFGDFNQRFGFDTGDKLLQAIAAKLASAMSDVGDAAVSTNVVARHGGEEFAVIFAEDVRHGRAPSESDAAALAETIRRNIVSTRVDDAGVTASIGVASLPTAARTSEELLYAADEALARSVELGGNRVEVAPDQEFFTESVAESDDEAAGEA
jgi:diguanylate cyclase (GGDEF)-like protein